MASTSAAAFPAVCARPAHSGDGRQGVEFGDIRSARPRRSSCDAHHVITKCRAARK
jgi:hypothetical protein